MDRGAATGKRAASGVAERRRRVRHAIPALRAFSSHPPPSSAQ
jgi:hypothetical protein